MKYSDIHISPRRDYKYKINKDLVYKDVTVPKGYLTNGADIPRVLWSIIPPNRSDILPAVIIHDYLFEQDDLEKANKYFKEVLKILGVREFDIHFLYAGVSIYVKFIKLMRKLGINYGR